MWVLLSFYWVPGSIVDPVESIRLNILIEIEAFLFISLFTLYMFFDIQVLYTTKGIFF